MPPDAFPPHPDGAPAHPSPELRNPAAPEPGTLRRATRRARVGAR